VDASGLARPADATTNTVTPISEAITLRIGALPPRNLVDQ
jgi:hypothetical protein